MSMWFICQVSDNSDYGLDYCCYALLELTPTLLLRLELLEGLIHDVEGKVPSLAEIVLWDYSPTYLDSLPNEWSAWEEDIEWGDAWFSLPSELDPGNEDLLRALMSRTECERLHVTPRYLYWSAVPKHTSSRVETPLFAPGLSPEDKIVLMGDGSET